VFIEQLEYPVDSHSADGSEFLWTVRMPERVAGVGSEVNLGEVVLERRHWFSVSPSEDALPVFLNSGGDEILAPPHFVVAAKRL
jgi:hypothetical protein